MRCAIYKRPRQMVVKVGSGSSGDSFELKGAEWADVKAGSLDSDLRAQAASVPRMRPSLQLERPHHSRHRTSSWQAMQVREATQLASHRPARTHRTGLITTEQPATEQPATEQPATYQLATEQPATEQPATEQPAADPALFEDPQVTEAAVAEATGGSVQRGKRARQQPARFGCADMKLSAVKVHSREDEDEALTGHGPPPPAPPPPHRLRGRHNRRHHRRPRHSLATAALAAATTTDFTCSRCRQRRHPDHRFSRSGLGAKGSHLSRRRFAQHYSNGAAEDRGGGQHYVSKPAF